MASCQQEQLSTAELSPVFDELIQNTATAYCGGRANEVETNTKAESLGSDKYRFRPGTHSNTELDRQAEDKGNTEGTDAHADTAKQSDESSEYHRLVTLCTGKSRARYKTAHSTDQGSVPIERPGYSGKTAACTHKDTGTAALAGKIVLPEFRQARSCSLAKDSDPGKAVKISSGHNAARTTDF